MNFINTEALRATYKRRNKEFKALKERLSKLRSSQLDNAFHQLHEEAFKQMECLSCANCCKTTSPLLTNRDIKRLSNKLNLSKNKFIKEYVRIDEDGDSILNQTPCVFLNQDNTCSIYEDRPDACRDYPHTQRRKMNKILNLTFENAKVCPAVFAMIDKIETSIDKR